MSEYTNFEIYSEISNLIDKLNYYTKVYDEGKPEITDSEWDKMYFRLESLEKETGIIMPKSPIHKISYEVINELKKVEHNHPMLSLQKTKSIDDIKSFFKDKEYIAMCKMDGLTCSLLYEDGKLISAETRGNGLVGEDVTHNIKYVHGVPLKINNKETMIVDGEVICTYPNFEPFSDEYKNPRNFASGSIRLLDNKECEKRNLTFVAWDWINYDGDSMMDALYMLDTYGFNVVPYCSHSGDIELDISTLKEESNKIYPIDGLVFKFDDIKYYKSLGQTAHHPNGGIAFKFEDEEVETKLIDIEYEPSRNGLLTPVAIFESVEVDGTIVERASMSNISVMNDIFHNIRPWTGQMITIRKSNMIIPQVISSEEWDASKEFDCNYIEELEVCPICGKPVSRNISDTNVITLYCDNPDCDGKIINKFNYFCGKSGLDIKGLSKATLEKLLNWEWIDDLHDIFELKSYRDEWIKKPGFGAKSVDNILTAIETSKNIQLCNFIASLGIPLIGLNVSKELCKKFETWEDFRKAINNKYKFWQLDGFGAEMHSSIINFDYTEADIISNYLIISNDITETEGTLNDIKVAITGRLETISRADLTDRIVNSGGKVVSAVNRTTNYLITNTPDSGSSKNENAKKFGVEIITEKDFINKFLS